MITFELCVVIDEEKKSVREFAEAEESILNTLTIAGMYLGEVSAGLTFSANEALLCPLTCMLCVYRQRRHGPKAVHPSANRVPQLGGQSQVRAERQHGRHEAPSAREVNEGQEAARYRLVLFPSRAHNSSTLFVMQPQLSNTFSNCGSRGPRASHKTSCSRKPRTSPRWYLSPVFYRSYL